ncbi:MAG: DUF2851 family protein [Candidatus Cloacimonetes bacterium]|nr:DUF2851 family protein [Candidatus Cloacimonadota bacterium]
MGAKSDLNKTIRDTTDFTERFLYHIWDAQHLATELETVSGKKLKIISPGRLSNAAGPDFREAVVSLGGDLQRGDVEIHKTTYDWIIHGHGEDPNYCNVKLHVVFQHNTWQEYTIDKQGQAVEILELKTNLDDDIKRILNDFEENPLIPEEKFCRFFAEQPAETLSVALSRYGKLRLLEKEKRFAAELYFTGFNQLAYQGLLEALGYASNKFQMLQMANTLTYEVLRKNFQDGMQDEEMIAIWLGSTGLLDSLPPSFPREFVLKWKELYANQNYHQETVEVNWHLFRIRPVNHPGIRLLQIAPLIYRSLSGSLFNDLIKLFSYPQGKLKMKEFYQRLETLFIGESYYLPKEWWLGKTRLDTVFINIILPLVRLYAQRNNYKELSEAAWEVYAQYRALPSNHLTRGMERYMDKMQIRTAQKKAIYQQGILHIYHNYCQYYSCGECGG